MSEQTMCALRLPQGTYCVLAKGHAGPCDGRVPENWGSDRIQALISAGVAAASQLDLDESAETAAQHCEEWANEKAGNPDLHALVLAARKRAAAFRALKSKP